MTYRNVLRSTFAFVVMLLLSATAHAQLFRAYLAPSPLGNDANACTLPAPCRLLPAALAAVADGGEIWMLDSANYNTGPVAITKSVTILAVPGVVGSVLATGGNAIDIATAGVKVALRNLVIVPQPGMGGTGGINMTAGAGLTVESCLLANLPGTGILVNAGASVHVTDTTIRGNGGAGVDIRNGARATVTRSTISGNANVGVMTQGTVASTATTADIADSTINTNLRGVMAYSSNATASVRVSVRESQVVQNNDFGVIAESTAGAPVTLSASNNIITNSIWGVGAYSAGSKVWVSGNTISGNNVGLINANAGGILESAGNNAMRNNVVDTSGSGAVTVIATK